MVTEGFSSPSNCMLQMFIWHSDGDKRSLAATVRATEADVLLVLKLMRITSVSGFTVFRMFDV